jgi:hypothetical protein
VAAFRAGTMLVFIRIGVSNDIIHMKTSSLDMERFFLFLLLDLNDRIKKVLSESIDVVHML